MMTESSSSSTLVSSLTAIGLFVATAAISQWISRTTTRRDDTKTKLTAEVVSKEVDNDLRKLYRRRRLCDRMSYEHLPQILLSSPHKNDDADEAEPLLASPATSESRQPVNGSTVSEWNQLQRQRRAAYVIPGFNFHSKQKQAQKHDFIPLTSRRLSEIEQQQQSVLIHPNAHYDFHPKNRNWRHFEHFNEYDKRRIKDKADKDKKDCVSHCLSNASGRSTKSNHNNNENRNIVDKSISNYCHLNDISVNRPTNSNSASAHQYDLSHSNLQVEHIEDDDGDDNDDQSISSSSMSSEEQFVWTKHSHRKVPGNNNNSFSNDKGIETATNNGSHYEIDNNREQHEKLSSMTRDSQEIGHQASMSIPPQSITKHYFDTAQRRAIFSEDSKQIPIPRMIRRMISLGSDDIPTKQEVDVSSRRNTVGLPNLEIQNRKIRAEYNARIMPEKVVLIRHGQSMGNINEVLYSTTPDNAMPLTRLGWEQAQKAGSILKNKILTPGETVHFIVSPYVRTVETFHGIVSAWCDPTSKKFASIQDHDEKVKAWYGRLMQLGLTWNEDSRLREQDFGNYQNPEVIKRAKEERHRFGAFYYRFPHGESASDVFDRVSTFLDSLWRSFEMNKSQNYVLVTHGIVLRVLLARYFRYTIDQFNILANPKNCEMVVLGNAGDGKLDLEGRCAFDVEEDSNTKEQHVTGYKFHKRLRILPRSAIRKVKIRISPDD